MMSSSKNARAPIRTIGLMSGTSLDGVDAVLLQQNWEGQSLQLVASAPVQQSLPTELIAVFRQLQTPHQHELEQAEWAGIMLAKVYAQAVTALCDTMQLEARDILAIGAHGQTVRHQPLQGYSTQILNGAWLSELTGINVVCNFRARDLAAGGQGAPLVPAFHRLLKNTLTTTKTINPSAPWAFLNLGGMANLTLGLTSKGSESIIGGDCGPANVLLDAWYQRHFPDLAYDANGAWAKTGKQHEALLKTLMAHPYFAKPLPKSCGYEEFNLPWLLEILKRFPSILPVDVEATLVALTAQSIADFLNQNAQALMIKAEMPPPYPLWVFGGGVHNEAVLEQLRQRLPHWQLDSTSQLGIHPQAMEAAAFAWFAAQTLQQQPSNCPSVTGATGERILGAVYFN